MDSEPFASIRQNTLGVMLVCLIEDYEARLRAAYAEAGFADVRRPHGYILRYLEQAGSPITEIARRAGISKQSAGKIVRELERLGYVEVSGIARDNRVCLVRFSARGGKLVKISQRLIADLHDDYAAQVGREVFGRFDTALNALVGALAPAIPLLHGARGQPAPPFFQFGRFMVELAADFERRLCQRLADQGFAGIKRSYLAILFHLDPCGSRLVALAQRIVISPQAANLTYNELAAAGLVQQTADPSDQRARLIVPTAAGHTLLAAIAGAVEEINDDYAVLAGGEVVADLRAGLLEILYRLRISIFV